MLAKQWQEYIIDEHFKENEMIFIKKDNKIR